MLVNLISFCLKFQEAKALCVLMLLLFVSYCSYCWSTNYQLRTLLKWLSDTMRLNRFNTSPWFSLATSTINHALIYILLFGSIRFQFSCFCVTISFAPMILCPQGNLKRWKSQVIVQVWFFYGGVGYFKYHKRLFKQANNLKNNIPKLANFDKILQISLFSTTFSDDWAQLY